VLLRSQLVDEYCFWPRQCVNLWSFRLWVSHAKWPYLLQVSKNQTVRRWPRCILKVDKFLGPKSIASSLQEKAKMFIDPVIAHAATFCSTSRTQKLQNTVHIGQPNYLNELIQPYQPVRTLRSSTSALLVFPFVRSDFASDAFSVSAPTLWNNLPQDVRSCANQATFKS